MRHLSAVLVVVVAALAGACGNDSASEPPKATTTSLTTTTTDPGGAFGTGPIVATSPAHGLLKDVRAVPGPVEQVVFEFEGDLPGYRIEYIERPVIQDGSGDEIAVDGAAVLNVHFQGASGVDLSGSELRLVYTGPNRIDPTTSAVIELVRVGDFEANLVWAIGLAGRLPFRVVTLDHPNRVVVEVRPEA